MIDLAGVLEALEKVAVVSNNPSRMPAERRPCLPWTNRIPLTAKPDFPSFPANDVVLVFRFSKYIKSIVAEH